jgi:hypothetical protein
VYSKNDDPGVGGGRPPSRFKASGLRSRHLVAHTFVDTTFPGAGHYSFVDHDMRHAEAGAMGMVEVSG